MENIDHDTSYEIEDDEIKTPGRFINTSEIMISRANSTMSKNIGTTQNAAKLTQNNHDDYDGENASDHSESYETDQLKYGEGKSDIIY